MAQITQTISAEIALSIDSGGWDSIGWDKGPWGGAFAQNLIIGAYLQDGFQRFYTFPTPTSNVVSENTDIWTDVDLVTR